MASIRQRGNFFQARVVRKGHPAYAKSFTSRSAAELWASGIEGMLAAGIELSFSGDRPKKCPQDAPSLSLSTALERYGRKITPSKRGAGQEIRRIRQLRLVPLAAKPLEDLRSADFAKYRDLRLVSVGPNTVRLELALLSHLFEMARREWGFESLQNPVKAIRKPKLPGGRTRRVTADELARLKERCAPKLWSLVNVAIETGMRRSELATLRWSQIDLARRLAALHQTKNGDPRLVPLSTRALSALGALCRAAGESDSRVFGLETADAITQAFSRACHAARIEGLRFHDLRHEAVSRLFERGLSLPEVASISGHKTWAMLRRYTHLSAETLVAKLD